jgi:hypothetical protein
MFVPPTIQPARAPSSAFAFSGVFGVVLFILHALTSHRCSLHFTHVLALCDASATLCSAS